jgi:hypothetical protein
MRPMIASAGIGFPWSRRAQSSAPDVAGPSSPVNHGRSITQTIEADTLVLVMSDATTQQVDEPATHNATFTHRYLADACLHGEHVVCATSTVGVMGEKEPATCEFCRARCLCICHPWSH